MQDLTVSSLIPSETVWRFRIDEEVERADLLHRMVEREFDIIQRNRAHFDDPDDPQTRNFNFFNHPSPTRERFSRFIEHCAGQVSGERFRAVRAITQIQLPGHSIQMHAHDVTRRNDLSQTGFIPLIFCYYLSHGQPITFYPYWLPPFRLAPGPGDLVMFRGDFHHGVDMVSDVRRLVSGTLELA